MPQPSASPQLKSNAAHRGIGGRPVRQFRTSSRTKTTATSCVVSKLPKFARNHDPLRSSTLNNPADLNWGLQGVLAPGWPPQWHFRFRLDVSFTGIETNA